MCEPVSHGSQHVSQQSSHTVMQFKPLKLYSVVAAKNGEDANGLKLD